MLPYLNCVNVRLDIHGLPWEAGLSGLVFTSRLGSDRLASLGSQDNSPKRVFGGLHGSVVSDLAHLLEFCDALSVGSLARCPSAPGRLAFKANQP